MTALSSLIPSLGNSASIRFIAETYELEVPESLDQKTLSDLQKKCFKYIYRDCQLGEWERINSLGDHIGAIDLTKSHNKHTPLHIAAEKGAVVAIPLLSKYIDINTRDSRKVDDEDEEEEGKTPLHIALLEGEYEAAACLIKQGADLDAKFSDQSQRQISAKEWLMINRHDEEVNKILDLAFPERLSGDNLKARELDQEGQNKLKEANYRGALKAYEQALDQRKTFSDRHPDVALNWKMIGRCHFLLENYIGALECYQKALKITEKSFGSTYPGRSDYLDSIGETLLVMERYSEAYEHHEKAWKVRKEYLGRWYESHPDRLKSHLHCGRALYHLGRFQEAWDNHLVHVTEIWMDNSKKIERMSDVHVIQNFTLLGEFYLGAQNFEKAKENFKKALRKAEENSKDRQAEIALINYQLGILYQKTREIMLALDHLKEALKIRENHFGKIHLLVKLTHEALGDYYFGQKQFQEALTSYRNALSIGEENSGINPLSVAVCCNHLGKTFLAMKRYDEAKEFYSRAIQLQQQPRPFLQQLSQQGMCQLDLDLIINLKTSYRGLAEAFFAIGRYEWAKENFENALKLLTRQSNTQSLKVAKIGQEINKKRGASFLNIQLRLATQVARALVLEAAEIYSRRGEIDQKLEKHEAAYHNYEEALNRNESVKGGELELRKAHIHDAMRKCVQALSRDSVALVHYKEALQNLASYIKRSHNLVDSEDRRKMLAPAEKLKRSLLNELSQFISEIRLDAVREPAKCLEEFNQMISLLVDWDIQLALICCKKVKGSSLLKKLESPSEAALRDEFRWNVEEVLYREGENSLKLQILVDRLRRMQDKTDQARNREETLGRLDYLLSALQGNLESSESESDLKLGKLFLGGVCSKIANIRDAIQILEKEYKENKYNPRMLSLSKCYELHWHFIRENRSANAQELIRCQRKLGDIYIRLGKYSEALKIYRPALRRLDFDNENEANDIYYHLKQVAQCYTGLKNDPKSLYYSIRAYEFLDLQAEEEYNTYIEFLEANMKSVVSQNWDLSTLERLNSFNLVDCLIEAGKILKQAGRLDAALRSFQRALDFKPTAEQEKVLGRFVQEVKSKVKRF